MIAGRSTDSLSVKKKERENKSTLICIVEWDLKKMGQVFGLMIDFLVVGTVLRGIYL